MTTVDPIVATVGDAVAETVGSPSVPRRIYAYTVVGKDTAPWTRTIGSTSKSGTGQIKVGETTKPTAKQRIHQQLGTAYPKLEGVDIMLDVPANRDDGTYFRDYAVHRALHAAGIRRVAGEWFQATIEEVQAAIASVRAGTTYDSTRTGDFPMRPEQEDAVALTAAYFNSPVGTKSEQAPRFLWNAKMRFGKTFTTYQLAREMGWTRILVLTYKPAVQVSWRDDLLSHVDFEGWRFIDRNTPLAEMDEAADGPDPVVWFASFQDLMGKTPEGAVKERNEAIHLTEWDCVVLDEYHFGAWRENARDLYDPTDEKVAAEEEPDDEVTEEDLGLEAAHFLYLSGTPFRAITNGEFTEDQVFNWTYPDEQRAKADWNAAHGLNPYLDLPGMTMYCYEMGQQATSMADDGEFNHFSLSDYKGCAPMRPLRASAQVPSCSRTRLGSASSCRCSVASCPSRCGSRCSPWARRPRSRTSHQISRRPRATPSGTCQMSRPATPCETRSQPTPTSAASRSSSPPGPRRDRALRPSRRSTGASARG